MKRDWELIRRILMAIETGKTRVSDIVLQVQEYRVYPFDVILGHLELAQEARFCKGFSRSLPEHWSRILLSWKGHEFLALAVNQKRWDKAMRDNLGFGGISETILFSVLRNEWHTDRLAFYGKELPGATE